MIEIKTFKLLPFLFLVLFLGVGCVSAADATNTDVDSVAFSESCGPVALQESLRISGVDVSCDELALELGTDESGTSMQQMIDVAQKHGTDLHGVESDARDVQVNDIVLLQTDKGYHYTVVTDIQPETITIHNPPSELSLKEFTTRYTGYKLTTNTNTKDRLLKSQELQTIKGHYGQILIRLGQCLTNNLCRKALERGAFSGASTAVGCLSNVNQCKKAIDEAWKRIK